MSEHEDTIASAGLRRITVHLSRGSVTFRRTAGEDVTVQAGEQMGVVRQDDELLVGGEACGIGAWAHVDSAGMKVPAGEGMDWAGQAGMPLNLANLGDQISGVVAGALRSLGGMFGSDVVIGLPAVLEHPVVTVITGLGDVRVAHLSADWSIRTGLGDVELLHCTGTLSAKSGKGDVCVEHFVGQASCATGAGDLRVHHLEGHLEARTGAGDVAVSGAVAGGRLHSGAGDLRAEEIAGEWTLRSGRGDILVQVTPQGGALAVQTGSGDVRVTGGSLTDLHAQTSSGDLTCESLLLGARHELVTQHGDIRLLLRNPPGARLQILTGSGAVVSDYPLVRVGKQGPQTAGGARYVGNVGDSAIEIVLRTAHGDVRVQRRDAAPGSVEPDRRMSGEAGTPQPAHGRYDVPEFSAATPVPTSSETRGPAGTEPPAPALSGSSPIVAPQVSTSDSARLRVLQSLQRGEISAYEAAVLLDSLVSGVRGMEGGREVTRG